MGFIIPNQDFLHGETRYEEGEEYEVDDGLAMYFELNGWTEDSSYNTEDNITLEIDDITQPQNTEVK